MDKEVDRLMEGQKNFRTDLDVLEDRVMDVEMSTKGAHTMMAPFEGQHSGAQRFRGQFVQPVGVGAC
jgi:hypothetical protein